jgi:hypothetical protein
MLFTISGLIVVACLPGAALFRVPLLDRRRRAGLDAEERAFWAIVVSIAWSSMVVLALAAAGRYTFGRLLAADAGVTVCLVLAFRQRLLYGSSARGPTRTILLPLALVALGCWLFFPPFEYVVGGKDPGVYVNEGIQIAQRGALVVHDTVVSSLPSQLRELFFPFSHNLEYYSGRFMGFFVLDPERGTVVGQFPHFYPAWIAMGYGLAGVRGALATTPVAAILGLLAVYFAGGRLIGRWPALVGSALLGLNVATIWFAREPNSEIVSQALIFAALLALARSQVDGDRFFAPVAGILLGLLLFLRIDAPVAVAAVGVAIVLQLFDRRRPSLQFVAPLVVLGAVAFVYVSTLLRAYVMLPWIAASSVEPSRLALLACAVLALCGLVVFSRSRRLAAFVRVVVPATLVVAVAGCAIYAYGFRVQTYGRGGLTWSDARSLEIFTWYFPPLALVVAIAGFGAVTWRSFWRAPALLVTIALYCFFVFYKIRVWPDHFWMARRFIPVILPGACLMAAAGLTLLASPPGSARRLRWIGLPVAGLLLVLITAPLVRAARPVANHVEYAGIISRLDALASRFGPDDLLVVNPRDASDIHVLALPLSYIWNRQALVLPSPKPDKALFRQFLEWARVRYRNVYFVGGGGTDLVSRSIAAEPVFGDRFQVPEYESRRNAYPREVRRKEFDFGVYRFTRPGTEGAAFALDVGHLDDLNVYRFHAKEQMDGVAFRWSRDASYVAMPRLDQARTLTLWLNDGGRPAKAPRASVTVYLDARLLGTVEVGPGFNPYTFAIVPEVWPASVTADDAATVKLVSTTWNPRQALGVADDRDLGVMVHRVEVR